MPSGGIVTDVVTNPLEFPFCSNDVLIVASLPYRLAGSVANLVDALRPIRS
jgi:hypothetical protein